LLTASEPRVIILFMIRIVIDGQEQLLETKKIRVEILLKKLHINPETALALRQGELLTEDEALQEGDTCIIMRTIAEQ
jgi:sulfur carrier protein ThiS